MGWSIHQPVGLIHYSPSLSYRGYTLFSTNRGKHATLIDMEGRICHRWTSDEGIGYAYLLPNGNLLCRTGPETETDIVNGLGGSSSALLELDWEGNVVWSYRNPLLHHDFERLPNGNTLVLLWDAMSKEFSSRVKGGYESEDDPDEMLGDNIEEITPDGTSVYKWRSEDHFDLDEDVVCPLENRREWGHGNSLNVTPDGDFVVSYRRTNTVGIVDKATGAFKWRWGPNEIAHQHNPTHLDNGNILIFDNGAHGRGNGASRIVEVNIESNEIVWQFAGSPPPSFYSFNISSAQRLPNGNTLICEGAPGRMFEVSSNKNIVWEYINPFFVLDPRSNGNANATFRAHRYGPEHPALQGKNLDPKNYETLNHLYAPGVG